MDERPVNAPRKDPWEATRRFFEELQKLREADQNPKLYTLKADRRGN